MSPQLIRGPRNKIMQNVMAEVMIRHPRRVTITVAFRFNGVLAPGAGHSIYPESSAH